ncbi:MAG: YkgJ family cysteine cluster protein [Desulfobacterales bacterium]|nr:YkgJ family cysteine cluster protein [Desulfobacterales bacterium]
MDSDKMAHIMPARIGPEGKFSFKCHKDVKCFTKCCRGIRITLTPYDIVRLKNRMGISSDEFLKVYTEPQLLEKTDLPMVTLRLLDDEQESCPFVKDEGCIVYEDRPSTCRYYPLGVGSLAHKEDADDEDFFFFVNEPHCLGFEEKKEWKVKDWRKDQGVDIHDEINAEWTDLVVRKRSFPPNVKLSEKSKKMFFMASYNIDKFREFVFESSFLSVHEVDPETVKKIKEDEIALLEFGLKWLMWVFFKKGDFKINQEASEARMKGKEGESEL